MPRQRIGRMATAQSQYDRDMASIRTILEAYTARKLGQIATVHDQGQQYAVRVDDMYFLVNLEQWNHGLDLDIVCNEDVAEVEFTSWPPTRRS